MLHRTHRRRSTITSQTVFALLAVTLLAAGCSSSEADEPDEPGSPVVESVDVYSFANGCYLLVEHFSQKPVINGDGEWRIGESSAKATAFRMQATDLGSYLLYAPRGEMIAAVGDDATEVTTEPGPLADWEVSAEGDSLTLTNFETGRSLATDDDGALVQSDGDTTSWELDETTGCDDFPDVDPGASGEPFVSEDPDGAVRGFFDGHTHMSGFRFLGGSFHCGKPWSRYGPQAALTDCEDHINGGVGSAAESLFSNGELGGTHEPSGWPDFEGWPKPGSLTHEGTYWRWIERAWRGGMRIVVNHLVENRALCEIYPLKEVDVCNDTDSAIQQAADMVDLQDYIDAQFGGPGKGFFRLVNTPAEAREVIGDGKLAVVLGIEVSEVLDCGLDGKAALCDEAQIDEGLDELYELGVRTVFPVHKFDNALGGTRYDGGIQGILVNAGNRYVTGEWWAPETCPEGAEPDNTIISPNGTIDAFAGQLVEILGDTVTSIIDGDLPTYPPGPHCNPRGLTDLGKYFVEALVERDMIIETDHMSIKARNDTLEILEERNYSGLITGHGWGDGVSQQRIVDLGGIVSPYASNAEGFVDSWKTAKAQAPEEFFFGIGFGTDTNGLGGQPNARADAAENPVVYPYTTFDGGTTMERQQTGNKTFDVNIDGAAHYGLFPDWVEDMRTLAGDDIVEDLANGAEAYLQMWERAEQG